jgi:hypothetical protein
MSDGTQEHAEQADPASGDSKLVPVGESIKYRRRAQQAEARIQELEQSLEELQAQLERRSEELGTAEAQRDEARHQLGVAESRMLAERLLSQAGVVDIEAASLLLTKRIELGDDLDQETLSRSVEQLLLDKPFLRGAPAAPLPPATAAARGQAPSPAARLSQAAERAAQTGDRKDVAAYLRLRRQASPSRGTAAASGA